MWCFARPFAVSLTYSHRTAVIDIIADFTPKRDIIPVFVAYRLYYGHIFG